MPRVLLATAVVSLGTLVGAVRLVSYLLVGMICSISCWWCVCVCVCVCACACACACVRACVRVCVPASLRVLCWSMAVHVNARFPYCSLSP